MCSCSLHCPSHTPSHITPPTGLWQTTPPPLPLSTHSYLRVIWVEIGRGRGWEGWRGVTPPTHNLTPCHCSQPTCYTFYTKSCLASTSLAAWFNLSLSVCNSIHDVTRAHVSDCHIGKKGGFNRVAIHSGLCQILSVPLTNRLVRI